MAGEHGRILVDNSLLPSPHREIAPKAKSSVASKGSAPHRRPERQASDRALPPIRDFSPHEDQVSALESSEVEQEAANTIGSFPQHSPFVHCPQG